MEKINANMIKQLSLQLTDICCEWTNPRKYATSCREGKGWKGRDGSIHLVLSQSKEGNRTHLCFCQLPFLYSQN